jgi:DNA-binding transcriptional regulator YiaG
MNYSTYLRKDWNIGQDYLRLGLAKSIAFVALPTFAYAFGVGTGGYRTPEFMLARGDIGYRNPNFTLRDAEPKEITSSSKDLEFIFEVLHLNQSELARALGVSRQTIYNWQEGDNISAPNAEKLASLAAAAQYLSQYDSRKIKGLMRRKFKGYTLLEAVSAGKSPIALAQLITSVVDREEAQKKRISKMIVGKPVREGWLNKLTTPHLIEEG